MKRLAFIFLCLLLAICLHGQTTAFYNFVSDHYRINSDISEEHAITVSAKMEAALRLFNDILHFDLTEMNVKLKVTIFETKDGFDEYLMRVLEHTRDNFVYIHYTDLAKSELVGFVKDKEEEFNSSLLHQGFIQFLKASIPNPPIWIREGLATYLENSLWDADDGEFTLRPNFVWLDSLKAILRGEDKTPIPLASLLTKDGDSVRQQFDTFYPQTWGLVAFILDSDIKKYNRILWDSISILDPEKSMKDNSLNIVKDVFGWLDESRMIRDFSTYISSIRTFYDLISEGITLYTIENLDAASDNFSHALKLEPQNFIPYYYLGLISYANKEYIQAEGYYKAALALGAELSLANYAIGVNAYADNRYEQATSFLLEAKENDPEKYGEKVDSLIQKIETLR